MKLIKYIKNINPIHLTLFVFSFFIILGIHFFYSYLLNSNQILFYSFYKPIFLGAVPFFASLLILLLVYRYFVWWLVFIATWYTLLTLVLVSSTSMHASYVFWGRAELAQLLMWGLFIITLIFTVVVLIKEKKQIK